MSLGQTTAARKAHCALANAIYSGVIARAETCESCGNPPKFYDKLQGHHDDYSKPLKVRWLCRSCHKRHHLADKDKPAPKRSRRTA